jgi:hypothetical protein
LPVRGITYRQRYSGQRLTATILRSKREIKNKINFGKNLEDFPSAASVCIQAPSKFKN